MEAMKARKEGNSIVITIPSAIGVKEDEEFYFIKKDTGAIVLIPKEKDHFEGVAEGGYYFPELDAEYSPSDGELDEI